MRRWSSRMPIFWHQTFAAAFVMKDEIYQIKNFSRDDVQVLVRPMRAKSI
jgi:hypothetical protein